MILFKFKELLAEAKVLVFGEGHARIDALLDYYYSIRQEKRSRIVNYALGIGVCALIGVIGLYVWGLMSLQGRFDGALGDLGELRELASSHSVLQTTYQEAVTRLKNSNPQDRIIPAIEDIAQEVGVEGEMEEKTLPLFSLQGGHVLSKNFQKTKLEYHLPGVSLRKMIQFITTLQKSPNMFHVTKLTLEQATQEKLYFDVKLVIEAYVSKT